MIKRSPPTADVPQVPSVPAWLARVPERDRRAPEEGAAATDPPSWRAAGQSAEQAAFRAGAALAHLHGLATGQVAAVPIALLRDRMALGAVEAGILRAGGRARAGDLRDRMAFLQPGARMDPETALFDLWRRAVTAGLRGDALRRLAQQGGALRDGMEAGDLEAGVDGPLASRPAPDGPIARPPAPDDPGAGGDPVARAADVLARARAARPKQEAFALIEADAALARALGWPRLLPLLATGLGRRDLALEGAGLRLACHVAVAREAIRAVRLAADLARRAERLRAVAPILRARASEAAVALFLARDAVAPTMDLAPTVRGSRTAMSPRAAARLCDRLVALGVVRELSGRATFRLYGL